MRGEPDGEAQCRRRAVELPECVAPIHTQRHLGHGLHTMRRRVAYLLLHADEVARQQKVQDLPAAIAQGLEAERPAAQQRVQRCVGLTFVNDGAVGRRTLGGRGGADRIAQEGSGRAATTGRVTPRWVSGYCEAWEIDAFGGDAGLSDRAALDAFIVAMKGADVA